MSKLDTTADLRSKLKAGKLASEQKEREEQAQEEQEAAAFTEAGDGPYGESQTIEPDESVLQKEEAGADPAGEAAEPFSADDSEEDGEPDAEEGKKEGKFFKKKKKEDKREKQLLDQIADLDDKLKRQMAEFDNFRKRTEREKSAMFEIGAKDIIERILPVLDNFERGLGAVSEEEREGAFVQGIEKIYKQLVTALEEAGVKPIEAVGQEFDPNFHNAVMHAEDEEMGENLVAEEFQKGYLYRDSVVRHSMVKVVN